MSRIGPSTIKSFSIIKIENQEPTFMHKKKVHSNQYLPPSPLYCIVSSLFFVKLFFFYLLDKSYEIERRVCGWRQIFKKARELISFMCGGQLKNIEMLCVAIKHAYIPKYFTIIGQKGKKMKTNRKTGYILYTPITILFLEKTKSHSPGIIPPKFGAVSLAFLDSMHSHQCPGITNHRCSLA